MMGTRVLFLTAWLLLSMATLPVRGQEGTGQRPVRSPRLTEVLAELHAGNSVAVQEFWQRMERDGTPLIERIPGDPWHYLTTFLWHAKEPITNVLLISGLSNNTYARGYVGQNLLSPLPGTDIWYRTYRVRSDARFTYELSVNDSLVPSEDEEHPDQRESRFRSDPLNPRHAAGPDSESLAELPDAPVQ